MQFLNMVKKKKKIDLVKRMTHLAVPLIYFPFGKAWQVLKKKHLFFLYQCQKQNQCVHRLQEGDAASDAAAAPALSGLSKKKFRSLLTEIIT